METHVKILAILKIVFGSLGLIMALIIFLIFGSVVGLIVMDEDEDGGPDVGAGLVGIAGTFIIFFLLLFSIPHFIAGYGLFKHAEWARILAIVLACLDLIAFPIGTALGIYGLWVLFNDETVALFKPRPLPRV